MMTTHNRLLNKYSDPRELKILLKYIYAQNGQEFPHSGIKKIYKEKTLYDIFNIDSEKTPDICAITYKGDIIFVEIKSTKLRNKSFEIRIQKGIYQVKEYIQIIEDAEITKNWGVTCSGFIITPEYYELI